jgi:hypothetical protein
MYIISKYKDYYDIGNSYGIDKTIVYNRVSLNNVDNSDIISIIPSQLIDIIYENRKYRFWNIFSEFRGKNYTPFLIGFCGKLILGFQCGSIYDDNVEYIYNIDELSNKYNVDEKKYKKISEFTLNIKNVNINNIFFEFNTPIFLFERDIKHRNHSFYCEINPKLSEYQFYRYYDAYQTFQNISMFMGGVLGGNENRTIEISNENKITQHGFDKWSFRNPDPPKRKRK